MMVDALRLSTLQLNWYVCNFRLTWLGAARAKPPVAGGMPCSADCVSQSDLVGACREPARQQFASLRLADEIARDLVAADGVQGFFISKPQACEQLKIWFSTSPYKIEPSDAVC